MGEAGDLEKKETRKQVLRLRKAEVTPSKGLGKEDARTRRRIVEEAQGNR